MRTNAWTEYMKEIVLFDIINNALKNSRSYSMIIDQSLFKFGTSALGTVISRE
jgi:hypothetical protein